MKMFPTFLIIWIIIGISEISAQLRTNFLIKYVEVCPTNGTIKYFVNITREHNKHYLNFQLDSPIPLDENVGGVCTIESALSGQGFLPLFIMRERYGCLALNKYLGEFWYDVERAAQMSVGVCPIREGRYAVHHHYLDFSRITLQTFPFGRLKFLIQAIDRRNGNILFCAKVEVENILK